MNIIFKSDKILSLIIIVSAGAWGLYWLPLRSIEQAGIIGSWSIVFVNACPLIILIPLLLFNLNQLKIYPKPILFAGIMIGSAFTFYANGLVETSVIRATLLFYLSPIWSTIIGIIWLNDRLTIARVISIFVALIGLFFLLYDLNDQENLILNFGDFSSLLSGLFWALGASILKKWSKVPILSLTTAVYLSTTILSIFLALIVYKAPFPSFSMIGQNFISAFIWSVIVLLPSFCIIFRISQILFPGRVGILMMSEVVVAVISAKILLPEEQMLILQWIGATAIVMAGLIEILFGYSKKK
ncbi:MAG: DMT family transporter [Paracoccaceae bacterium]|tara:strand:+ start:129 stop:1025 length:897 start_codon:yes stop_codon:yes gene_type:complete